MYLLLPLESLTSLLKTRDISKRKRWRSLPFLIRVLGSHTWKDSWRINSPWDSMFSSKPNRTHDSQSYHAHVYMRSQACLGVCDQIPSSMLRCIASLALLGTLSMTSKPSLISPFPSSQHVSSSYTHKHKCPLTFTLRLKGFHTLHYEGRYC